MSEVEADIDSKVDALVAKIKGYEEEWPKQTNWGDDYKEHHYYVQSSKKRNETYEGFMNLPSAKRRSRRRSRSRKSRRTRRTRRRRRR